MGGFLEIANLAALWIYLIYYKSTRVRDLLLENHKSSLNFYLHYDYLRNEQKQTFQPASGNAFIKRINLKLNEKSVGNVLNSVYQGGIRSEKNKLKLLGKNTNNIKNLDTIHNMAFQNEQHSKMDLVEFNNYQNKNDINDFKNKNENLKNSRSNYNSNRNFNLEENSKNNFLAVEQNSKKI